LIGRVVVGRITDRAKAERILGTDDLWEAKYHVIAVPGTESALRDLDVSDLAGALRFESDRDRLKLTDGLVNPGQLQTMRQLTEPSARLLAQRWDGSKGCVADSQEGRIGYGAGFGPAEQNREVEAAAVAAATRELAARGWRVRSVERDRVGYDLHCRRRRSELHVEVKGSSGGLETFFMTDGELRRAKNDSDFALCLVTHALSAEPELEVLRRNRFLRQFAFRAVTFQAVRKKSVDG